MKKLFTISIILLISVPVVAQIEYPIDIELRKCLEGAVSTVDMNGCYVKSIEVWDEELNKYYKLYLPLLNKKNQEILRTAQRNWITYRDKEYKLIEAHFLSEMRGSLNGSSSYGSKLAIVKDRALKLQTYYEDLEYR